MLNLSYLIQTQRKKFFVFGSLQNLYLKHQREKRDKKRKEKNIKNLDVCFLVKICVETIS